MIVKRNGQYGFKKETEQHHDRPDRHIAILRTLKGGGQHISNGECRTATQNIRNHLVQFTVSHAMGDIYTQGRLLLDSVGQDFEQRSNILWKSRCSCDRAGMLIESKWNRLLCWYCSQQLSILSCPVQA